MPIYEFTCGECGKNFDQLCKISWEGTVQCPACGTKKVSKNLSRICRPGGGSCSSGGCSGCSGCK